MFNRYLQFRTVLGAGGVFLDGEGVHNNKELMVEQGIGQLINLLTWSVQTTRDLCR